MTAIVERPVAPPAEAGSRRALALAEGLDLLGQLHGSGYKDGAALVRRADGQMVQLGPLMFTLLECVDGRRSRVELAAAMTERLGRQVDEDHVERLGQKLAEQGLLAGSEDKAPPKSNPLLALRWKYLVTNPVVTRRLTAPFTTLFKPWIVVPVLAAFLAVVWFVVVHKGVASATAQAFQSPELLLLVFLLAVGSAGFHELGHAAACRYGGGTPGGMGVGLYMVWPAFYTDVTDSYRLPKRDRLRVDLGGLYFNTVVAVATLGAWLALRVDALLLLVALQLVQMVKQLSPVIRADGYHILSDLTGVPDLYAHMGPTLRRLIPGRRREPSALTGRARALVTAWVLIVVPILVALSVSVVLLMPRLLATAWASGQNIAGGIPGQDDPIDVLASVLRLVALVLPVLGAIAMSQRIVRLGVVKARAWSEDRPGRRAALTLVGAGLICALVWAWWPSGQYRPVRASDDGTIAGAGVLLTSPASAARPVAEPARIEPGKHLAVAMIPEGGATDEHPAFFVMKGDDGQEPVVVVSPTAPDPSRAPAAASPPAGTAAPAPQSAPQPTTSASTTGDPVTATALPFRLPAKPGPHGTQALAVNTKDGAVKYVIAYSLVTVHDGRAVDETNEAYAFASCTACTTVAVSFQVVLIVGQSDLIAPINVAGALNVNCAACITTAIANQIVVTLTAEPTPELLQALSEELKTLDALPALGADGSPEQISAEVEEVEAQIHEQLEQSGLIAGSDSTTSTTPTGTGETAPAPTPTSTAPTETTTTTQTSETTTSTSDQTAPTSAETTPDDSTSTETTTTQTTTTDTTTTETTTEPSSTDTTSTPSSTDGSG